MRRVGRRIQGEREVPLVGQKKEARGKAGASCLVVGWRVMVPLLEAASGLRFLRGRWEERVGGAMMDYVMLSPHADSSRKACKGRGLILVLLLEVSSPAALVPIPVNNWKGESSYRFADNGVLDTVA